MAIIHVLMLGGNPVSTTFMSLSFVIASFRCLWLFPLVVVSNSRLSSLPLLVASRSFVLE